MHPIFEGLFKRLVQRWEIYQDAPRDPELVTTLAAARADLDDARGEIAKVRETYYAEHAAPVQGGPGVAVDPDTYRRIRLSAFQDTA